MSLEQSSLFREDFFTKYFSYCSGNEVPVIASRWSAITSVGAFLGKSVWIKFGTKNLYPNIYCVLIGTPGSRKSTAITTFRDKILVPAGFTDLAAEKTSKEKYMMDLAGIGDSEGGAFGQPQKNGYAILEENLFGSSKTYTDSFICADELNDFFGNNNLEFISFLGTLWDYDRDYSSRIKNGKSVLIPNPTISLLGGNTPVSLAKAFPPEIIGQGFFSRVLWIYCEAKGIKIAWPRTPSAEESELMVKEFQSIKSLHTGEIILDERVKKLLGDIYEKWKGVDDVRFDSYSTRRHTYLLKLCIVHAMAAGSKTIRESDVIYTNTVLSYAEHFMPKALGEFGKAKNSDVSHKIISFLEKQQRPAQLKEIWKQVNNDLDKLPDLITVLQNLQMAGKIQQEMGGFLVKRTQLDEREANKYVDWSLLTEEERRLI